MTRVPGATCRALALLVGLGAAACGARTELHESGPAGDLDEDGAGAAGGPSACSEPPAQWIVAADRDPTDDLAPKMVLARRSSAGEIWAGGAGQLRSALRCSETAVHGTGPYFLAHLSSDLGVLQETRLPPIGFKDLELDAEDNAYVLVSPNTKTAEAPSNWAMLRASGREQPIYAEPIFELGEPSDLCVSPDGRVVVLLSGSPQQSVEAAVAWFDESLRLVRLQLLRPLDGKQADLHACAFVDDKIAVLATGRGSFEIASETVELGDSEGGDTQLLLFDQSGALAGRNVVGRAGYLFRMVSTEGALYIAGLHNVGGSWNTISLPDSGASRAFVVRVRSDLEPEWLKLVEGAVPHAMIDLWPARDGGVILAIRPEGTLGPPGPAAIDGITLPERDVAVKLDAAGTVRWVFGERMIVTSVAELEGEDLLVGGAYRVDALPVALGDWPVPTEEVPQYGLLAMLAAQSIH